MYGIFDALKVAREGIGGVTFIELMVVLLVFTLVLSASLAFAGTVGRVTGTGADITVSLGFEPSHVRVISNTTGNQLEWFAPMPDDSAVRITNAVDGTGVSIVVLNGITPDPGFATATTGQIVNAPGFKIGADTKVNVNGKELFYEVDR